MRRSRKRSLRRFFALLLLAFLAVVAWFGFQAYRKVFHPFQGFPKSAVVRIENGMPVQVIARRLEQQGVIASAEYFTRYYRLFFAKRKLKAGEYLFDAPLSMRQVLRKLEEGKAILYKVTVKEGLMIGEIARVFAAAMLFPAAEFVQAAGDVSLVRDMDSEANDLEGYLFPDTYRVPAKAEPADILGAMLNNFEEKTPADLSAAAAQSGFSLWQAVTLASIVEREAVQADERPLIASVYRNRLTGACDADVGGSYLQADPTVQYARGRPGDWWWKPTSIEEYQFVQDPYNTYLNPGLPPGPIASPGISSLEAAVRPAETQYCFFVATGEDGRHVFARTLAEHEANVATYGGG